jgi:hypothetical protein
MNTDKHTCVCATCAQGFTRRSRAVRHIKNLHSGQAMIVKPYDYIIGRLKGEFSPSDPDVYRSNRRNQTNSLAYNHPFQAKANDRTNFRIHADVRTHGSHPPNSIYPIDSQGRAQYPSSGNPHGPINQNMAYVSNRVAERNLKLEELQRLLYVNYPPQVAAQQFAQITYLVNKANDDAFLDTFLDSLRFRSG